MTPEEKQAAIVLEELQRKEELSDIRKVMATREGRRFVWRLMEAGNIFRKCMTGNSTTFFLLGCREVVLPFYMDIMEACPDLFAKAQQENFKSQGVKS